jgi:ABC-2 type transport system permease protein
MKKYLEVARVLFKTQLIYRFDVIMNVLTVAGRALFAWILWGAVFAGREQVGAFTFRTMLSYYIVSAFLASLDLSEGISGEVSNRIRNGTFSKFMVIPAGPQRYFLAQNFGAAAYYGLFGLACAAVMVFIFRLNLAVTGSLAIFFCALVMEGIGLVFMASYHYFIGILCFKFQDTGFFLHIQGHIIAFTSGIFIPLSLLPDGIRALFRFLPFYYVNYLPAMLLTGQDVKAEALPGLLIISAWAVFMLTASRAMYHHLRVHYDGVGI